MANAGTQDLTAAQWGPEQRMQTTIDGLPALLPPSSFEKLPAAEIVMEEPLRISADDVRIVKYEIARAPGWCARPVPCVRGCGPAVVFSHHPGL